MFSVAAVLFGATPATPAAAPKNAIAITPAVNAPRFGIGLGYDRAVHRLLSVGARFEYAIPRRGYGHLQGLTETLALTLWVPRTFRGFFAEASIGLAHSVLASQPLFRRTAIVPGLSAGLRWRFGKTFFAGASVGLRWGRLVRNDTAICTYSAACPATRSGPWVRAALDVGFAF
jgi:hypothetical protein